MFRRLLIAGLVALLVGHLSPSALADHNCCQTGLYCASSATLTEADCLAVGGTFFAAPTLCDASGTQECTIVKTGSPPPVCSDGAPLECYTLLGIEPPGVPTVSQWGLAALLLLIVAAATVTLLKRRRPATA